MDSKKLVSMACAKSGNLKAFASAANIPYNTLYSSTRSDDKLDNMPVSNFLKVAHALNMRPEDLFAELGLS